MNEVVKVKPALKSGGHIAPIVPTTIEEVARMAEAVFYAGLAPDSYRSNSAEETRAKIIVGICKGAEVGFPPITALSTIAIINGRPCIWGDGAVALAQKQGKMEWIKEWFEGTEGEDDWTAFCEVKRSDQDEPVKKKFSVKDARRAHLWNNPKKQPWIQYPQRMLQMRARSWALRDGFADCLHGLAIAEEVRDLPQEAPQIATDFLDDEPALEAPQEPQDAQEPETAPDTPETEESPPEPQEPTPGEKYVAQMTKVIAECETTEEIDLTVKGMKPHLNAIDEASVEKIKAMVQERRKNLGKLV